jgi:precorrin isomerase
MASAAQVQLDVDEKSPEVPAVEMQSSGQKGGSASAAAAATHFWKVRFCACSARALCWPPWFLQ